MKILYIITQADGGGAQKYVLTLAKHFQGMIAAGNEADKLFDDAKKAGLMVYPLIHLKRNIHPWHDFWAILEIRQLIEALKPDIVHLNSTKAGILGSFAAMGLKTKVLFTAHGFRFLEPLSFPMRMFYLALEKVASTYRDFIITVSNKDKEAALQNKLIQENKIKTIYNGIGPINFLNKDDAKKELGLQINNNVKVIGVIANAYPTKGLDVLEKATKLIKTQSPAPITVVIGQSPDDKTATNNDAFRKLGHKPNASLYLKAFDIFAIPSRKEGFPFTLLEAMLAGLPIVATKVGGIPEALGDAGILVEPEKPEALAGALDKLLTDDNLAFELSQKALERSQLFTEEKMLDETRKVYEELLNKKTGI